MKLADHGEFIWGLANGAQYSYVGEGNGSITVYAIVPETGRIVWKQTGHFPSRRELNLFVRNQTVYVLFDTGIFVLNSMTGEIIDQYPADLPTFDQDPNVADDLTFIDPLEGIAAVNLDNGREVWRFSPACIEDASQNEGPSRDGRYFLYAPSPDGDNVYTTGGCRMIFALDKQTGAKKWEYNNKGVGSISRIAALDNIGYALFSDWSIRAINLRTGEQEGILETHSEQPSMWAKGLQGVAIWNDMLYTTMGNNTLYVFGK